MNRSTDQPLLPPSDQQRLGDLMFVARRMVEGLFAGRHRSPRRGHSTEFYDYRPYFPGDEARRIDWRLWARTDRLFVRRYRHDAELTIHLLVDRSASMDFARLRTTEQPRRTVGEVTKFDYARRLAAALAFLAVRQADRVGLTWVDERAEPVVSPGGSWGTLRRIMAELEAGRCAGRTDPVGFLTGACRAARANVAGRGLVVLISDMLDPPADWLRGLSPWLHGRFDIVALQVLTPTELDLGRMGSMRLVDAETRQSIRTGGPDLRRRYHRAMAEHVEQMRRALGRHGMDHQLWTTATPPIEALRGYVARRAEAAAVG